MLLLIVIKAEKPGVDKPGWSPINAKWVIIKTDPSQQFSWLQTVLSFCIHGKFPSKAWVIELLLSLNCRLPAPFCKSHSSSTLVVWKLLLSPCPNSQCAPKGSSSFPLPPGSSHTTKSFPIYNTNYYKSELIPPDLVMAQIQDLILLLLLQNKWS